MRLPARSRLANMHPSNRAEMIELCARDASAEVWGLEEGIITLVNGLTKPRALDNARRRLKRANAVAAEYGLPAA